MGWLPRFHFALVVSVLVVSFALPFAFSCPKCFRVWETKSYHEWARTLLDVGGVVVIHSVLLKFVPRMSPSVQVLYILFGVVLGLYLVVKVVLLAKVERAEDTTCDVLSMCGVWGGVVVVLGNSVIAYSFHRVLLKAADNDKAYAHLSGNPSNIEVILQHIQQHITTSVNSNTPSLPPFSPHHHDEDDFDLPPNLLSILPSLPPCLHHSLKQSTHTLLTTNNTINTTQHSSTSTHSPHSPHKWVVVQRRDGVVMERLRSEVGGRGGVGKCGKCGLLREVGIVAADPKHLLLTLLDTDRRPDWDRQCRTEHVVHTYSDNADIVFYRLNSRANLPMIRDRYLLCLRVHFTIEHNLRSMRWAQQDTAHRHEPYHVIVLSAVPCPVLPPKCGVLATIQVGGYIVRPHSRISFGTNTRSGAHMTRVIQLSYGGFIPRALGDSFFFRKQGAIIPLLRQVLYRDHATLPALHPEPISPRFRTHALSFATAASQPLLQQQQQQHHTPSEASVAENLRLTSASSSFDFPEQGADMADPAATASVQLGWRQLVDDSAWRELLSRTPSLNISNPNNNGSYYHHHSNSAGASSTVSISSRSHVPESPLFISASLPAHARTNSTAQPQHRAAATTISSDNSVQFVAESRDVLSNHRLVLRKRLRFLVSQFNRSETPQAVLEQMISGGFIEDDATDIATFLLRTQGLSRMQVGHVLSFSDSRWRSVLEAYVSLFDFSGMLLDDAVRIFLKSFALPREAQQIDRVVQQFAQRFARCNENSPLGDPDTAYLVSFSVLMLNTDLHNTHVQSSFHRMTAEQFVNNLRGANQGQDLPSSLLVDIYHRIAANEIKVTTDEVVSTFVDAHVQGWLEKESGTIKLWKWRWCVLQHASLFYFKKPEDSQPHGIIALENITVRKVGNRTFELCPVAGGVVKSNKVHNGAVVSGSHSHFVFRAKTEEEVCQWTFLIRSAIFVTPILAASVVAKQRKLVGEKTTPSKAAQATYEVSTKSL